jgi:MFS family permease
MMLLGLFIAILGPLVYAIAIDWHMLMPGVIFFAIAPGFLTMIGNVILANALSDEHKTTGFGIIGSVAMLPTIAAPMVAAFIVISLGGISAEGIRPLFLIQFISLCFSTCIVYYLIEEKNRKTLRMDSSFLSDFKAVFKEGKALKTMMLLQLLDLFGFSLETPFGMPFAVKVKGATPLIIGYMGIASSIGGLIFSVPVGRIADRIGRKSTMFLVKPIYYTSLILLVLAPSPELLVLSWALRSIAYCTGFLWQTMFLGMVPESYRGRWSAIIYLLQAVGSIPGPTLGALLWEYINPTIPFLTHLMIDMFVLMPILKSIPSTLVNPKKLVQANKSI